jgi:hypothetical protein
MRALGRGAAVLVRYAQERFIVYEAVEGAAGQENVACANQPSPSCLRAGWADTDQDTRREVEGFRLDRPEYRDANVGVTVSGPSGTTAQLDVCFNPGGQAFARTDLVATLAPLTSVVGASVVRSGATALRRQVAVLPNGMATVSASLAP